MAYDSTTTGMPLGNPFTPSDLIQQLLKQKKTAREFVSRRREQWDDTYELYRNKVLTNRLTQRQIVNIPLMKETIKTIIAKIDEPPNVEWRELGGDRDKELILQEIWNMDSDRLNFPALDIQDKKTVLLYGRGFKKINWADGEFQLRCLDIYDVLVDPLVDPIDLETARFVIHTNIFRSLREILADERYTKEGKDKLKIWEDSKEGIVQSGKAREEWEKKMRRLKDMGVESTDFPHFAAGDVIVNLTEHYHDEWSTNEKKFIRKVTTYANDNIELLDEKLEDLLGVTFYPYVTWAEDVETQDFWCDGPGDLVRTPNKILNIWFSQLVENRTLKNFQMHWYDATIQGYTPQTYDPGPGRMLPAPGDPNKTIMPVNIEGLDDTFGAIDFVIKMVEKGSSTSAIEKGVADKKKMTRGEIQLLAQRAMERTTAMAKFYRRGWEELANKYYKILEANASGKRVLYKVSRSGKIWPKTVYASDWKSEKGYKAIVKSSSERDEEKNRSIQRFMALLQQFPGNQALVKIAQKRMLEIVDLSPEEMREVEESQKQVEEAMKQAQQGNVGQPAQSIQSAQPAQPAQPERNPQEESLFNSIQGHLKALAT